MKRLVGLVGAIALAPSLAHSQAPHAFHLIGMIDADSQVGFVDTSELAHHGSVVTYSQIWIYTPPIVVGNSVIAYVVRRDEDDCLKGTRRQISSALYDSRSDLLKMAINAFPPNKVPPGGNAENSHKLVCSERAGAKDKTLPSLKSAIELAGQLSGSAREMGEPAR